MRISISAALLVALSLAALPDTSGAATQANCEGLISLKLPHATITQARSITTGRFTPPGSTMHFDKLPPFCRVSVKSSPSPDSLIDIEIWIPLGRAWNGKFLQVGCGGFCGTLQYQYIPLARALRRGYAGAADDAGNQSPGDGSFALGHPQKIEDFGYRALKETTDKSKAVLLALAGRAPERSYFNGCSGGGREALIEAQRFPEDFDGIIVGAPANNWIRMFAGMVANEQALLDDPASYIAGAKLPLLSKAVLAHCGKQDSGAPGDAFLSDPLHCSFDPATVECAAGQSADSCLTAAQVRAAKAIYGGPRDPRTARRIVPGFVPGNEDDPADWPIWIIGASRQADLTDNTKPPTLPLAPTRGALQEFYGNSFFAYFVYQDPKLDFHSLKIGAAVAAADQRVGKIIDAIDPDLRPFERHGGKIIQYHGWADSALTPLNSVNYYNQVRALLSGGASTTAASFERIQRFYRLFMVPGMAHCGGGPGANEFGGFNDPPVIDADHDILTALERWVEQGVAPEKIVATHFLDGDPARGIQFQRPLCPFPQVAHYDGKGDPADAGSFVCRAGGRDPRP
ncbi:MAG TPA: tannase/feruloyl esterase family alpha/beta hydrolase [Steroidobacteraceae bacterium]|nr:tannase/feruloyl esterase family alpha/beta hydrolase [Steroidobacteraceae bacterium]